jgi:hypothetical protein
MTDLERERAELIELRDKATTLRGRRWYEARLKEFEGKMPKVELELAA